MGETSYLEVGRQKQEARAKLIPSDWQLSSDIKLQQNVLEVPETCGILTAREIEITGQNDAVSIVRKISNRTYTAREVTVAFCKRAAIAQQLVNCLTEIFFDEAIKRAEDLDREQTENPSKALRPLHGLPISLKDSFKVPGYDSTIGFVAFANKPDMEYSPLAQLLLDEGAVLYCKTNVPQTLMTGDSQNNVFGRTLNPNRVNLTAGGSSGGEGALVVLRGSVLGVGTDVAGSVRIPALSCGVYGIRPSAEVIPYAGQTSPARPGTTGVLSVAGPLATSLRACDLFMQVVVNAQPWIYDVDCQHRAPWKHLVTKSNRIRIGLVRSDDIQTPWPPVRRALAEAAAKVRADGFDVVELTLPSIKEVLQVAGGIFGADGGRFYRSVLDEGAEPFIDSYKRLWGDGVAEPKSAASLEEFFTLRAARTRLQQTFQNFWTDNNLDIILMPGAPHPAPPHDQWRSASYTLLWNFLDHPAIIIPHGKVLETDVSDGIENAKLGESDQETYKIYTGPKDFLGAPLAVQVVGMRGEDDKLVAMAEQVDLALRG